jgi:hypothetical protein
MENIDGLTRRLITFGLNLLLTAFILTGCDSIAAGANQQIELGRIEKFVLKDITDPQSISLSPDGTKVALIAISKTYPRSETEEIVWREYVFDLTSERLNWLNAWDVDPADKYYDGMGRYGYINFLSNSEGVFLIPLDSSLYTYNFANQRPVNVTPNQKMLSTEATVHLAQNNQVAITNRDHFFIVNLDSGEITQDVQYGSGSARGIRITPDGNRILYVAEETVHIVERSANGYFPEYLSPADDQVSTDLPIGLLGTLTLAPNSQTAVYTTMYGLNAVGNYDHCGLVRIDLATKEKRQLTDDCGQLPAFSPDSNHIAYITAESINTYDLRTNSIQQIIPRPESATQLILTKMIAYLPDGKGLMVLNLTIPHECSDYCCDYQCKKIEGVVTLEIVHFK